MTDLTRDDVRAAVGSGMISERQAAALLTLSDTRRGVRERMTGLDEPFELFRGFNEIFIVIGLSILGAGWIGLTLAGSLISNASSSVFTLISVLFAMVVTVGLAKYFTERRRMIAPSILLVIFFAVTTFLIGQIFNHLIFSDASFMTPWGAGLSAVLLFGYYVCFRVPFTMVLIAGNIFLMVLLALEIFEGSSVREFQDFFLLSADGPFGLAVFLLGVATLVVALWFDTSDPHRVTRRSVSGFWLHIVAAPAIVNTVALTLFSTGTISGQIWLVGFVLAAATFAIVIDRRSFLVSGVGYIVALSVIALDGSPFFAILILGVVLVFLGAKWEVIRRHLMNGLPGFPGKSRLPPWDIPQEPT